MDKVVVGVHKRYIHVQLAFQREHMSNLKSLPK